MSNPKINWDKFVLFSAIGVLLFSCAAPPAIPTPVPPPAATTTSAQPQRPPTSSPTQVSIVTTRSPSATATTASSRSPTTPTTSSLRTKESSPPAPTSAPQSQSSPIPWIDVHAHPIPAGGAPNACTGDCLSIFSKDMDKYATRMILFMPPPLWSAGARGPNSTQWESNVRTSALSDSAHFAYAGGGYLLNPMIHAAEKTLSSQTEAEFEKLARDMAKSGVVGFGEIALLHLTPVGSQFIEIPNAGKNRLLLKLADVAAENNLPIDIHMEAVPKDMQTPSLYEKFDPANPDTLKENIKGFEALLSYNPKTRYVWAHAGWDNTGGRTVQLTERLLKDHPNLYLHLQLTNVTRLFPENNVLDTQGKIQATWSALFEKYPDRVMVGTDRFSSSESGRDNAVFTSGSQVQAFLKQLPGTVVNNIACRNAVELYHLKSSC